MKLFILALSAFVALSTVSTSTTPKDFQFFNFFYNRPNLLIQTRNWFIQTLRSNMLGSIKRCWQKCKQKSMVWSMKCRLLYQIFWKAVPLRRWRNITLTSLPFKRNMFRCLRLSMRWHRENAEPMQKQCWTQQHNSPGLKPATAPAFIIREWSLRSITPTRLWCDSMIFTVKFKPSLSRVSSLKMLSWPRNRLSMISPTFMRPFKLVGRFRSQSWRQLKILCRLSLLIKIGSSETATTPYRTSPR